MSFFHCVCVYLSCLQVSGDHQHPGWEDLCSGSSQPGQEAVGPGCGIGLPSVLQPEQTRGEIQHFKLRRIKEYTGRCTGSVSTTIKSDWLCFQLQLCYLLSCIITRVDETIMNLTIIVNSNFCHHSCSSRSDRNSLAD